ncbi:MAG: hypothetical protein QF570_11440 [Myxococcota bacterium]|jgi:type II secretory pathway predicted ATPase ExeA|nr:hypothetical protein [Myxococcota bacterium]
MAAYLRFYQFDSSPFDGSVTKRGMVLGTQALRGALAQVKQALDEGAPRICLSGPSGLGKTSFGRALPKLLAQEAQVAVAIDPTRSWEDIRARAGKKFGVEGGAMSRKSLIAARKPGKQLVIVFDQAEMLSHETLDHLDILLQYKDDDGQQLVHCVMLANLEAAASGAEIPLLWWLDKFTTLQLQFSPIPVEGIRHYVEKHLAKAGWAGGELFTPDALRAIHANTGGVPASINALCERILIEGGIRGVTSINEDFIDQLCGTDLASPRPTREPRESAEHSADLSIGEFATGPSAQEMLDDPNAQAGLDDEPEVTLRPEPPAAPATAQEDIASLLVTQDSPEHLHTASEEPPAKQDASASLELEDEPESDKFADFYEQQETPTQLVGISRPGSANASIPAPKRRMSGWWIAAAALAGVAWFAWSRLSMPTELIETAEVEIEKALEKPPKNAASETKATGDAFASEDTPPDASKTLANADDPAATGNATTIGSPTRPNEAANLAAKPAAKSEPDTATAKPRPAVKQPSTDIPSEMLVINEYTAIPKAASAAAKLPISDAHDDEALDQRTEQPPASPASAPETSKPLAIETPAKADPPASIAPTKALPSEAPTSGAADVPTETTASNAATTPTALQTSTPAPTATPTPDA